MARPCKCRWIGRHKNNVVFKPLGFPIRRHGVVKLALDELEALKQAHLLGLTQKQGAEAMGVSRPTFGRILENAHHKIADALCHEQTIAIGGGPVVMNKRRFQCQDCDHSWDEPYGTGHPEKCPWCGSECFMRLDAWARRPGQCRAGAGRGARRGRNQTDNKETR